MAEPTGVWIASEDVRRRPGADHFHGRVAAVVSAAVARKLIGESDEATLLRGRLGFGLYCEIEIDGRRATICTDHLFTAPDGAKAGDAFSPELDVQGDTDGVAAGEGYEVEFSGMCPVQGDGGIDGFPCYYRARGKGWSLEVYPVGGSTETTEALWSTARSCYVWPAGGYLRADLSRQNIERAVAAFRVWRASR